MAMMKLQESLTKENFWNEMMEKYPNATKKFCEWIDEYKMDCGWDILFANNVRFDYDVEGGLGKKIKFHDIPHAMQQGIWLEYLCQRGGCTWEIENFFEYNLREDIETAFEKLLEDEAKDENEL